MNGTARSFNAVALQSDAFGKSSIFKDPIFSNLNLDQEGDVVFDFSAVIDPVRVSYAALVLNALSNETPVDTDTSNTTAP